jgi:hypothetical protein
MLTFDPLKSAQSPWPLRPKGGLPAIADLATDHYAAGVQ